MDLAINVDLIIEINQTANGLYLFSRLVFYTKLYTIEGIQNIVGFVSKLESFCLMIFSINPKKIFIIEDSCVKDKDRFKEQIMYRKSRVVNGLISWDFFKARVEHAQRSSVAKRIWSSIARVRSGQYFL